MTHASVAGMSPRLLMNGILAGSEEGFDLQVSIDLLEEKFYAPTQLVKMAADQSWEDKLFVRHINAFPGHGSQPVKFSPCFCEPLRPWPSERSGRNAEQWSDQQGSIGCEKTACLHNRKQAPRHTRGSI